jgi:hypothetical protein
MNSKAKKPASTGLPSMRPAPAMKASLIPTSRRAARTRSTYFLESRNPSGSMLSTVLSTSRKVPSSMMRAMRSRVENRKWNSHFGQTSSSTCRSAVVRVSRHPGHLVKTPAGTLRFSLEGSSSLVRLYQAIVSIYAAPPEGAGSGHFR